MSKHYVINAGFLLAIVWSMVANAKSPDVERVIWEKKPIAFSLQVGKERLAHFPSKVRYWVPSSIEDAITILSVNGVVYVTAHTTFDKMRIRVQNLETQKIYLLDLVATDEATVSNELIITDEEYVESKSENYEKPFDWLVRLTRFAAQHHYAEERLLPSDEDIRAIRIETKTPVPLVRGGDIEALAIKSWQGGGYYITAVRIRNLTSDDVSIIHTATDAARLIQRTLILDKDIRGHWVAITPQHTTLGKAGNESDVTTLYLISDKLFWESI